jgi:acylphosphatase
VVAAVESTSLRFHVFGRVQGVGFRWFAQRAAQRLRVSGWVANQPDGTVAGEVTGETAAVDEFLDALRAGPSGGRVDAVETATAAPAAEPGFVIRRG